jgi:hypothetical protein
MRTAGNAADRGWRTWKKKNSILGGVLVGPAERSALLRFGGEGGGLGVFIRILCPCVQYVYWGWPQVGCHIEEIDLQSHLVHPSLGLLCCV